MSTCFTTSAMKGISHWVPEEAPFELAEVALRRIATGGPTGVAG